MTDDASPVTPMLHRIAVALGMPLGELVSPSEPAAAGPIPSAAEMAALFAAFTGLKDPQARQRVIAAAESELHRTDRP